MVKIRYIFQLIIRLSKENKKVNMYHSCMSLSSPNLEVHCYVQINNVRR